MESLLLLLVLVELCCSNSAFFFLQFMEVVPWFLHLCKTLNGEDNGTITFIVVVSVRL